MRLVTLVSTCMSVNFHHISKCELLFHYIHETCPLEQFSLGNLVLFIVVNTYVLYAGRVSADSAIIRLIIQFVSAS
jgi:hypothetical protein